MAGDLNIEKGKQGFQPTTRGVNAPTPAPPTPPTAPDEPAANPVQTYLDSYRNFTKSNESGSPTGQAVLARGGTYLNLPADAPDLSDNECEQLLQACRSTEHGSQFTHTEDFQQAWRSALHDSQTRKMLRRCYFTDSGDLRPDVGKDGNYTAETVYMNASLAQERSDNGIADREHRKVAALTLAYVEYINDRIPAPRGERQPYIYPDGGRYPQLDILLRENTKLNPFDSRAIVIGYYGPNAG